MSTAINCAILFSGNGSNMQNLIESLHKRRFYNQNKELRILEINVTICNNPSAYGINRSLALNIPCEIIPHKNFTSRDAFDNAIGEVLQKYKIHYVFLAGFMRILTPAFTKRFSIINIHPSFLPEHKGANAIKDSFYSNQNYGGVSVHWVNEELDSGNIIMQEKIEKQQNESLENFEHRIHLCEYSLYPRAIINALGLLEDCPSIAQETKYNV